MKSDEVKVIPLNQDEDVKAVKAFMDKPENQNKALMLAQQVRNLFGRQWFTISELEDQFKEGKSPEEGELKKQMAILGAYGLARVRLKSGKKITDAGVRYRICLKSVVNKKKEDASK